ncbi:MAG TPA: prolyl oligopeptidase family serine peptidase [Vicinamibacterales bacterium]|jgi:dipeptidyl aminopeptidase/acylaminoacyl peptidase|nr:prolyl oligopeptidase family serine peptidase [Vicinamibacterales bacterium]
MMEWSRAYTFTLFLSTALRSVGAQVVGPTGDAGATLRDLAAPAQFLGPTALTGDGEWVAFTVCDRSDRITKEERDGCSISTMNTTDRAVQHVMSSGWTTYGPSWSPDGRLLAFYATRGGPPSVWVWDRKNRSVHRLSGRPIQTDEDYEAPVWAPDGRHVVVKVSRKSVQEERGMSHSKDERSPRGPTVDILLSPSARTDSVGSQVTAAADADLALIDVTTARLRILVPAVRTKYYRFSPDGTSLAYTNFVDYILAADGASGSYTAVFDLCVLDLATAQSHVVASHIQQGTGTAFSWSPDSRTLAYLSGSSLVFPDYRDGYSIRSALFVVPSHGGPSRAFSTGGGRVDTLFQSYEFGPLWDQRGEHVYLTDAQHLWSGALATLRLTSVPTPPSLDVEAIVQSADANRAWSPDSGRSLIVLTTDSLTKRAGIYRINVIDGTLTRLRESDEAYTTYTFLDAPVGSDDGKRVVLQRESATDPPDLWIANATFSSMERLSASNPRLVGTSFGRSQLVKFWSEDGQELGATLLLPATHVEGKRCPLVVALYAGHYDSQNLNRFGLWYVYNLQILVTRGYAVLAPDIPLHMGTPAQDINKAVMPAIDRVIDLGIADPDRLAVIGQSNGGYSALTLITQSTRFKAAIVSSGFGNLTSLYGMMSSTGDGEWIQWLERLEGAIGAPPWEAPQRYIANSPVFFLDRVRTPVLMEVGIDDIENTHMSNEVFVGLKRLGRDVTYLRYSGESHVLSQVPNLVDYWSRVLTFLDAHVVRGTATQGADGQRVGRQ